MLTHNIAHIYKKVNDMKNSPPNWLKLNRVWSTREYHEALNQVEPIRRTIFGGYLPHPLAQARAEARRLWVSLACLASPSEA